MGLRSVIEKNRTAVQDTVLAPETIAIWHTTLHIAADPMDEQFDRLSSSAVQPVGPLNQPINIAGVFEIQNEMRMDRKKQPQPSALMNPSP